MEKPKSILSSVTTGPAKIVFGFITYVLSAIILPAIVAIPIVVLLPFHPRVNAIFAAPFVFITAAFVLASLGVQEHPITTFGKEKNIYSETFVGDSVQCVECGIEVDRGEKRQFSEQMVAFGYPLYTTEHGVNPYCPWCAEGMDSPSAEDSVDRSDRCKQDRDLLIE